MESWHAVSAREVARRLETDIVRGLTEGEAARRLAAHGPNELRAARPVSPWTLLTNQFRNVLIIILLIATGLSAFLGHGVEAIVITVIVLFAVVLGFRVKTGYDPRFSEASYGINVYCRSEEKPRYVDLLRNAGAVEIDEFRD